MHLLRQTDGQLALQVARLYVESAVTGKKPEKESQLPAIFSEKRGVFVTLSKLGGLRGCIGFQLPVMSLGNAIKEAAEHAAIHDPRFYPVDKDELKKIKVEVTVLTQPSPLEGEPNARPSAVIVGKHGLIAEMNGHSGLLLPQVATEYNWTSEEFLGETCNKAGLPHNAWKNASCSILTFEGQIFKE
ncbi:MAG TPA: TIGR00296 family protein [Methanocorpusculum sp.]|nr:TIGR00296 family protein [Methanocorpusculum sp.]